MGLDEDGKDVLVVLKDTCDEIEDRNDSDGNEASCCV